MKKGHLFIISGPSGVGKGCIRTQVMKNEGLNMVYSISVTTRAKRPFETEGVDYYFISQERFDEDVKRGNFLEYNAFVGHSYGTPKDKVMDLLSSGKNVLLEIDVNGAKQVMAALGKEVTTIFILPPSMDELEKRIRGRKTEREGDIERRLKRAREEIACQGCYDYCVVNDDIERASNEVIGLIEKTIGR